MPRYPVAAKRLPVDFIALPFVRETGLFLISYIRAGASQDLHVVTPEKYVLG